MNTGFLRGIVLDNADDIHMGRCKIYIPGVYPSVALTNSNMLPWSEPAMPLFGGSGPSSGASRFSSTGFTSSPANGSYVWVFFEGGDQNYPKHFAATQAGDSWMSEHEMQHVLSTDNFRLTIDENTSDDQSSLKNDTLNDDCTEMSKSAVYEDRPVRVQVEISAKNMIALDLKITGDVNLFIKGDLYTKVDGNVHETVMGNKYTKIHGDHQVEVDGYEHVTIEKTRYTTVSETDKLGVGENKETIVVGDNKEEIGGKEDVFVGANRNLTTGGSNVQTTAGIHSHL